MLLEDCWKVLSGWNSSSISEFRQVERYYSNHPSTIQLMLRWQFRLNGLKRRKSIQSPWIPNICVWTFAKNWSAGFFCQFHLGKWLGVFAKLECCPLQYKLLNYCIHPHAKLLVVWRRQAFQNPRAENKVWQRRTFCSQRTYVVNKTCWNNNFVAQVIYNMTFRSWKTHALLKCDEL